MPSTVIEGVDYDRARLQLRVTFTTGRIYEYANVPADVVAELLSAGSRGAYFNRRIRDKYPFREITDEGS
jgi:hypothetical protein